MLSHKGPQGAYCMYFFILHVLLQHHMGGQWWIIKDLLLPWVAK